MKNNIVIATTTINPPTKALIKHTQIHDFPIVVVGDLKTPHEMYKNLKNVIYLHPDDQEKKYKDLSDSIGWNKIERRNLAILEAYNMGADTIAIIDDDNVPYSDWGQNVTLNKDIEVNFFDTALPAFDPLYPTDQNHLWQRGYPLDLVQKRQECRVNKKIIKPMAQIDLWDGDPDIDAIMRMIYNPRVNIDSKYFPYSSNALMPFNSQNIFVHRNAIKDYFLFTDVGRNHDIFAAYYFTAAGHEIVINKPSVFSDRSLGTAGRYSALNDVKSEYYSMERVSDMVNDLNNDKDNIYKYISNNSKKAFEIWKKEIK
jgi:hypothetical protein